MRLDPWLGSRALLVSLAFVAARPLVGQSGVLVLYVAFNALFNLPHQYCTWVRAVRDPVQPAPDRALRAVGWLLAALALVSLLRADTLGPTNQALLVNALPYCGIWHLVAQHFGISSWLRRRTGEASAPAGDRAFFLALFVLGTVHFHALHALEFHVAGTVSTMWRLPIPPSTRPLVAAATSVLFLAVCALWLGAAFRVNAVRARFQSAVALSTFAAFFLCSDILVTVAAITALHNLHYMSLVQSYQRGRAQWDDRARALGKRDVVLAALYSLAVHAALLVWRPAGEVLLATLVALHYAVDGQLWRFRRDPSLSRYLEPA